MSGIMNADRCYRDTRIRKREGIAGSRNLTWNWHTFLTRLLLFPFSMFSSFQTFLYLFLNLPVDYDYELLRSDTSTFLSLEQDIGFHKYQ